MKLAAAPISWGVSELAGWGLQLGSDRVLGDMRVLGMAATESGPPGFLPADAHEARTLLAEHGLTLVGGFAAAVLHDPRRRDDEIAALDRQARWLADAGAAVLVLAASTGRVGYSETLDIGEAGWRALFASLDLVDAIARRHGLTLAVHPHFGTAIETREHIDRFLSGCGHGLCLDTGHVALGGADPVSVAERAGDRVCHVHLKDLDPRLAPRVRDRRLDYAAGVRGGLYCALGEGGARIADVLALLRSRGYDGWYVLERDVMLDEEPAGVPPGISSSVAFARSHA